MRLVHVGVVALFAWGCGPRGSDAVHDGAGAADAAADGVHEMGEGGAHDVEAASWEASVSEQLTLPDLPEGVSLWASALRRGATTGEAWHFVRRELPRDTSGHLESRLIGAQARAMMAGLAAGDIDRDGFVDVYVTRGDAPDVWLRNRGGTLEAVEASALGVQQPRTPEGEAVSGAPLLADFDGDGDLDLYVGGASLEPALVGGGLWLGDGRGSFELAPSAWVPASVVPVFSVATGDYDLDGDLDLVTTHWLERGGISLWQNVGDGFADGNARSHLSPLGDNDGLLRGALSANFADLDDDGYPELLVAVDFADSVVLHNDASALHPMQGLALDDGSGMGTAVADLDGDLDLDWFVSAVFAERCSECSIDVSGNRLYLNDAGRLSDDSEGSALRDGGWGWAACAADFDLDGDLDLLHVNGTVPYEPSHEIFVDDPLKLFINQGAGQFVEQAAALGIDDREQGRAVVCFDHDRDGDVDVLLQNHDAPLVLWTNELHEGHALSVSLTMRTSNSSAIGARVWARTGDHWQMQELVGGSHYASHDPHELHFGLGVAEQVDELRIRWPTAELPETRLGPLAADQRIEVHFEP